MRRRLNRLANRSISSNPTWRFLYRTKTNEYSELLIKMSLNFRKHRTFLHVSWLVPFSPVHIFFFNSSIASHTIPH